MGAERGQTGPGLGFKKEPNRAGGKGGTATCGTSQPVTAAINSSPSLVPRLHHHPYPAPRVGLAGSESKTSRGTGLSPHSSKSVTACSCQPRSSVGSSSHWVTCS